MATDEGSRGEIVYEQQGFAIRWDPVGLEIDVIDYHAKTLRLSWKDLLALERIARKDV